MNYLKLFVAVFAMALAMNAGAQSKTTAKSKSVTTTAAPAKKTTTAAPARSTTTARATTSSSKKSSSSVSNRGYDPKLRVLLETRIGSGLGENIVLEKEYHKYVAVDFFSIGYTSGDWHFDSHKISAKVGARGFSPSWWGDRMRAYTDFALGYDCIIVSPKGLGTTTSHGFGLTWGIGVQMFKRFYFGYSLDYTTIGGGKVDAGDVAGMVDDELADFGGLAGLAGLGVAIPDIPDVDTGGGSAVTHYFKFGVKF